MKEKGTLVDVNYLKSVRVLRGLNAKEAAARVGMDYAAFRYKENGVTAFTDKEKLVVFEKYGMTLDEFNRAFFGGKLPIKETGGSQ